MLWRWTVVYVALLVAASAVASPKIVVQLYDVRFVENGTLVTANMSLDFPGEPEKNRGDSLPETARTDSTFDVPSGIAIAVKNYLIAQYAALDPPVILVADEIWVFGAPQ